MIKYSLLRILRDRVTIFWALCFPFILATLFEVSFGHMNDSLDQIQTAVVVKRDGQAAQTFQKFLKEVQKKIMICSLFLQWIKKKPIGN